MKTRKMQTKSILSYKSDLSLSLDVISQFLIYVGDSKEEKKDEMSLGLDGQVIKPVSKKYLIFRPYVDPMSLRPYKPPDRGYYFKFHNNTDIRLIRYTLEDNGFREATNRHQEWTMLWSCTNIKSNVFQSLTRY